MNMQVSISGADRPAPRARDAACPFCGEHPPLSAHQFHFGINRFVVGCENEDCDVQPTVSAPTLNDAWKRWNKRA